MLFTLALALAATLTSVSAGLTGAQMVNLTNIHPLSATTIPCAVDRVPHLTLPDCQYLQRAGFSDQGINAGSPNGRAWIGTNGRYTFTFTNRATNPSPVPVILVMWLWEHEQDYEAMCVNVRRPYITYSLPNVGDSVTISVAPGNTGAFAAVNNHATVVNQYGQVSNTWGEFNTKPGGATFDVSREVDMNGNVVRMRGGNGCESNFSKCTFKCVNGQRSCLDAGSYDLFNCGPPNPGAHRDPGPNGTNGGCGGWGNDNHGHVDVELARY